MVCSHNIYFKNKNENLIPYNFFFMKKKFFKNQMVANINRSDQFIDYGHIKNLNSMYMHNHLIKTQKLQELGGENLPLY